MISRGSEWHRWEPHIHAPATILNNQFGASDPWGTYLTTLEGVTPKIRAIAVTHYYVTDAYEEFLKHKASGRLSGVELLFPNIELRLDVAAKSGFVNVHLLVSPEDPDHLSETTRILKRLQFHAFNDRFDCTRDELIKLGKRADPRITDDGPALRHGATQFKVNFDQLRKVIGESEWAKNNVLIAVADGADDGTSGVRQAADATVRQEIEKFAHIIFSSSPAQREFWIGQRSATLDELRARYDGCKPCLHGSDSHAQESVGRPAENRFSWIKGALEFDALRQACIDPESRICWRAAATLRLTVTGRLARQDHRRGLGYHSRYCSESRTRRHHRRAGVGKDSPGRRDRRGLRCDYARWLGRRREHQSVVFGKVTQVDRRRDNDTDMGRWRDSHAVARWKGRKRPHVLSARPLSLTTVC